MYNIKHANFLHCFITFRDLKLFKIDVSLVETREKF